jgi:hypothetical protein
MKSIINNIYSLPYEIQNKIFIIYWQFKYNDVMLEIINLKKKDCYIFDFLIKNINVLTGQYSTNYLFHFYKINNLIKDIYCNRGLMLLSNINNYHMKNINIINLSNYYDNFKYLLYYLQTVIRINNKTILNFFKPLKI